MRTRATLLFLLSFPLVGNLSGSPLLKGDKGGCFRRDSLLGESPEATGQAGMTDLLRSGLLGRSGAGFTLLELIVVLFVISLVMAIILPSFAGLGTSRLRSEAREMASVLRYLNDSAASGKKTFPVKFDFNNNRVSWKGPDGERTRQFEDMTAIEAQSTGMVSRGEVILFFEPLGIRENISVHMSRGDKNMTVTLNHLSGKVKIEEKDEG